MLRTSLEFSPWRQQLSNRPGCALRVDLVPGPQELHIVNGHDPGTDSLEVPHFRILKFPLTLRQVDLIDIPGDSGQDQLVDPCITQSQAQAMEALTIENEVKLPSTWKEGTHVDLTLKKATHQVYESPSTYSIEVQV